MTHSIVDVVARLKAAEAVCREADWFITDMDRANGHMSTAKALNIRFALAEWRRVCEQ